MPEEERVDNSGNQQQEVVSTTTTASRKPGRPARQHKEEAATSSQEVPAFSLNDLIGKQVEMRLTSTRDGDSTVCGVLVATDDFLIYIQEGNEEVTMYNPAHMISIRARRLTPQTKGREDFVKAGENDVVQNSQNDIERQKAENQKRRDEIVKKNREKVSSQQFK